MKRLGFIVLAALAACGGGSITATPGIKADVTTALQSVAPANLALRNAFLLKRAGAVAAAAMQSGSLAGLDVSQGIAPERTETPLDETEPASLTSITVAPSGCIRQDPNQATSAVLIASGTGSCAAAAQLEIDYSNGDVAIVAWGGSGSTFTLVVSVTAGAYAGSAVTSTFAPAHLTGSVRFATQPGSLIPDIDSDLDWTYMSSSAGVGSSGDQVVGNATDHLAGVLVSAAMTGTETAQSDGGVTDQESGEIAVQLLDASGNPGNVVVWPDFSISETAAQGAVLWNGKQAGSLVFTQGGVQTAYTDGTSADLTNALVDFTLTAPSY
jgi:hypothetical protein